MCGQTVTISDALAAVVGVVFLSLLSHALHHGLVPRFTEGWAWKRHSHAGLIPTKSHGSPLAFPLSNDFKRAGTTCTPLADQDGGDCFLSHGEKSFLKGWLEPARCCHYSFTGQNVFSDKAENHHQFQLQLLHLLMELGLEENKNGVQKKDKKLFHKGALLELSSSCTWLSC